VILYAAPAYISADWRTATASIGERVSFPRRTADVPRVIILDRYRMGRISTPLQDAIYRDINYCLDALDGIYAHYYDEWEEHICFVPQPDGSLAELTKPIKI